MGEKPLRISFDKIDGFIKINDGINHNFARNRNDSYNSLLIEKVSLRQLLIRMKITTIYFFKKNNYYDTCF